MDLGLDGRVALVTGASSGIGLATCHSLAREGATVVGVARRPMTFDDAITYLQHDLSDPKAPSDAVQQVIDRFGQLDILVNNVGIGRLHTGFLETSDDEWLTTLNLNLMSAVRAIRSALPHLIENHGVIANVSSANWRTPVPQISDYGASKAALNSLAKAVSKEFAGQGVRVVTVSPGPVSTPMWLGPDGAAAQIAAMSGSDDAASVAAATAASLPQGRFSTAEEVADAIAFLVSNRAGSITGIDLLIDGGGTTTT